MDNNHLISERLCHKLKDALVGMEIINYFIIIKTLPSYAHAFGALLDTMDLAGKAGTTRETVSMLMNQLNREQVISVASKKIRIHQPDYFKGT